ncbi:MAG: molybdopterin-dependent oxidoreductase, partial [Bryocella sp.]
FAGTKLREIKEARGADAIGVIGSNRTTNEESYLLQKFARTVIGTNNIDHHRTADFVTLVTTIGSTTREGGGTRYASQRCIEKASAILFVGGDPTNQAPLTAWNTRTNVRQRKARVYVANHEEIKLRRQSKLAVQVSQFGYGAFAAYLNGDDASANAASTVEQADTLSAFRETIKGEETLVVIVGNEVRGGELAALIRALPNAKFGLTGDYVNSRGASDMGMLPDVMPGYQAVGSGEFAVSSKPGLDLLAMFDAAQAGNLGALYVVGSNPVKRYGIEPSALKDTFVVVQDLFLTETAKLADVVFPAANLYEKSGSVTNSYGDVQLVSKAADRAGVRTDFELILRLADAMNHDVKLLVPFGNGVRADMGQSRGVQSGEADRHAVWMVANNLEPKLSPFDPFAILDEIQRVVPGYDKLLRLQLLSANDQNVTPAATGLVQIENRKDLVLPSADTLFSSGSLTRYSPILQDLQQHQNREVADHLVAE